MVLKLAAVLMILLLILEEDGVQCSCPTCSSRTFNIKDGIKDRALESRIFKTLPIKDYHSECFSKCSLDCRCLSFNVCDKQCQLNADDKDMKNNSLKIRLGCTHYDLPRTTTTVFPRCCLMSNPCHNGGTCAPASGLKTKRRFSCLCRHGFYGNLCETKNPRSCADFMVESVKPLSGEYKILDDNGKPFAGYCDFDSEPGFAWTMLLSFSRDNAPSIQSHGLLEDLPVNEDELNWESYRLSVSRMNSIRKHSTHWRATCGFDINGIDYQEYIRVDLSVVDFSAYYYDHSSSNRETGCQTIEYMNIWGSECHNCNFGLYHASNSLPFLSFVFSKTGSYCTFDLSSKQHLCGGYTAYSFYVSMGNCYDPRSMCQMSASSTTQNWFGA